MNAKEFLDLYLRGAGQVFLQNNPITGALFLAGIFLNSVEMGIGAVLGTLVGTLTGFLLKYDKEELQNGFYGFNGILTGIAAVLFFGFNTIGFVFLVIGSLLSSIIMYYMKSFLQKYNLPALTGPFVFSTWIIILLGYVFGVLKFITTKSLFAGGFLDLNLFLIGVLKGPAQVMFQNSFITGLVFLVGIFINSRKAGIFAFLGMVSGVIVAALFGFSADLNAIGFFSFSAVLTGIALGESFKEINYKTIFYVLCSIVATVFMTIVLEILLGFAGLQAFTFPFVVTTLIFLSVKNKVWVGE